MQSVYGWPPSPYLYGTSSASSAPLHHQMAVPSYNPSLYAATAPFPTASRPLVSYRTSATSYSTQQTTFSPLPWLQTSVLDLSLPSPAPGHPLLSPTDLVGPVSRPAPQVPVRKSLPPSYLASGHTTTPTSTPKFTRQWPSCTSTPTQLPAYTHSIAPATYSHQTYYRSPVDVWSSINRSACGSPDSGFSSSYSGSPCPSPDYGSAASRSASPQYAPSTSPPTPIHPQSTVYSTNTLPDVPHPAAYLPATNVSTFPASWVPTSGIRSSGTFGSPHPTSGSVTAALTSWTAAATKDLPAAQCEVQPVVIKPTQLPTAATHSIPLLPQFPAGQGNQSLAPSATTSVALPHVKPESQCTVPAKVPTLWMTPFLPTPAVVTAQQPMLTPAPTKKSASKRRGDVTKANRQSGRKRKECAHCDKTFSTRAHLLYHLRAAHDTGPRDMARIQCDVCSKVFSHPASLVVHRRQHTGEKPHACTECGKAFTDRSSLKRHFRVHTQERPYECDVCGADFTQIANLRRHQKSMHQHRSSNL